MAELESVIEQRLIEQLIYGTSQWTYRPDLKSEEELWNNFRYILEQNNKDRLDGEHLSDAEFEQVKNQLQFSSFYKSRRVAGGRKWQGNGTCTARYKAPAFSGDEPRAYCGRKQRL